MNKLQQRKVPPKSDDRGMRQPLRKEPPQGGVLPPIQRKLQFPARVKVGNVLHRFADALAGKPDDRMLSEAYRVDNTAYGMTITPYNPDALIVKKGYDIIEQMRHDDMVRAVMTMKKFARLAPGWDVRSASPAKSDIKAANFVRWNLEKLEGTFESDLLQTMTALDYGFSIGEIVWELNQDKGDTYNGKFTLKSIKHRRPNQIEFFQDEHGNLETDGVAQWKSNGELARMPTHKFLVYPYQKEFDNYYGMTDYRAFYREWWIKTVVLKFYAMWLERFPFPPTIGWYPPGTTDDRIDDLEDILESLQIAASATLPMGITIDQLEIPSTGADVYESALRVLNKGITRGALVPDLLGFTDTSTRGSYALGKKHFDVFLWILIALGRELSSVYSEQLFTQMTGFNYDASPPVLELISPEEDTEARSKVLQIWVNTGVVDPDEDWVRDYLNVPQKGESYLRRYSVPYQRTVNYAEQRSNGGGRKKNDQRRTMNDQRQMMNDQRRIDAFRELTVYEEKVGFDPQGTDILWERWVSKAAGEAAKIFWDGIDKLLPKLEALFKKQDGIDALTSGLSGNELAEVMNSMMVEVYFESKLSALGEVERALNQRIDFSSSGSPPLGGTSPSHFQDFPKPTETIEKYRKRVPMTKKEWQRLSKRFRDRAFTMAGQTNTDIIEKFKSLLFEAIDEDWTLEQFQKAIEKEGMRYTGRAWRIEPGELIKPWHSELIFRNQIGEIYNDARKSLFYNKDVSKFVPALQYSAILDTRTRPTHAGLDGLVYLKDDLIWQEIYPPNGHNCRCIVIPVTSNLEFEVSESTDIRADKGFGGGKNEPD